MKLWSKNFIFVFTVNLLNAHSFYIFLAVIPLYVTERLLMDDSYVGVVMGAFTVTGVLVRPFAGVMLDSISRIKIYRPALVLFMLCSGGYLLAKSFFALILLRFAHGFSWGIMGTSGNTIASDIIPKERRAEGLGYYTLAMNLGMAFAPSIGLFLLGILDFFGAFFACLILTVISTILGFNIKPPELPSKKPSFTLNNLFEKKVFGIALMQLLYGISYGSVMGFAILHGKQLGVEKAGLFFMLFAIAMAVTRPLSGKYLDKNGPKNAIGLGFILVFISLLILSQAKSSLLFFVSAPILGVGGGIVMPLFIAMAMNLVEPNRRGAATATVFSAFDLGIGGGSFVLGFIAKATSKPTMYIISAFIVLLPLVFYYAFVKNQYYNAIDKK